MQVWTKIMVDRVMHDAGRRKEKEKKRETEAKAKKSPQLPIAPEIHAYCPILH
jgi:hypothetical protein